ncbi:MAG: HlyD family secretion protein [Solirubrobacterales bacterium]|jgi:RND family efflux transporter MFP subunit|nr:HlyD family secretion protein [Solirubrobacterales bacterium]
MAVARPRIVVGAVLAAAAAAVGLPLATQNSGGPKQAAGTFATVGRGVVDKTVGGVGHVTTLTGAALLSVPSTFSSSAGAGGTGVGSSASTGTSPATTTGTSSTAAATAGSTPAPADAVFPTVTGYVSRLFVHPGEKVSAGQPVASISDGGASVGAVLQARNELATARLELAQKRTHDILLGPPPTPAELAAGQQAIVTAKTTLRDLAASPTPAEVAAARSELARTVAELHSSRASPAAIKAAELAVTTAQQNLQTLTGTPDPAELAAAQLEVANAVLGQASLSPEPTPAESAAAQAAVTAAQLKLNQLISPPPAVVSAAQGELAKAELDLQALLATRHGTGLSALRAAVVAARSRLAHLRPTEAVFATAQSEVRRARADLAVLRQRGAPASAIDQALAGLKVVVSRQRLGLAKQLTGQLTVRARASGTVTSMLTTAGAAADPATPLMRVQDLGNLVVALELSEFDVAHVRVGELTRVSVDALGGRQVKGRVIDVSPIGTEVGGVVNFPITIALKTAGGGVRPGMSVSARIVTRIRRNVIRIPSTAVSGGDRPTVKVRRPSGTLTRRPVELGLEGPSLVEVRSGLQAGDRVLVPAGGGE